MHQTSADYEEIASGKYDVGYRLMVMSDEPFAIWENSIISISADYQAMGDEAPGVGYACAATMDAEILAIDTEIPNGAKIILQCQIKNASKASEWLNKGVFYVNTRTVTRDSNGNAVSVRLECYDGMVRCETEYKVDSGTTWTAKTDAGILTEIMTKAGTESLWVPNKGYQITNAPQDMTGRSIIGYLAAMYGGNAAFNDDGKLILIPLKVG